MWRCTALTQGKRALAEYYRAVPQQARQSFAPTTATAPPPGVGALHGELAKAS